MGDLFARVQVTNVGTPALEAQAFVQRPAPLPALSATVLHRWKARHNTTVLAGGAVSSWRDFVGSIDMLQATGADRPVLTAAAVGLKEGLVFDGVSHHLEAAIATIAQPFAVVVIYAGFPGQGVADEHLVAGVLPVVSMGGDSAQVFRMAAPTSVAPGQVLAAGVHDVIFNFSGATSGVYLDAVFGSVVNAGTNALGTPLIFGAGDAAGTDPADATLAEVIILNAVATQADATALNAYRVKEWAA